MMIKAAIKAIALGVTTALASCGGGSGSDTTAVPRPTAYPRVEAHDSAYTPMHEAPLIFEVSDHARKMATSRPDGSVWINIDYPAYQATIYCTFTPVNGKEAAQQVMDNRLERIMLNLGSDSPEYTDFTTPEGYYALIVRAPSVSSTPLQFLAAHADNPRWVLSGSLFLHNAAEISSVEEVKPVIDILERDILHTINSLQSK